MKCCSSEKIDIERHYKRMTERFYTLDGLNDPSLKNTFITSLPETIQEEMWRILNMANMEPVNMTLGQIYQTCFTAIDKICSQQKMFEKMMNERSQFIKPCTRSYLKIKCKDDCRCDTKKSSKSTNKFPKQKIGRRKGRRKRNFRFFRRRKFKTNSKEVKCYACGKNDIIQKTVLRNQISL